MFWRSWPCVLSVALLGVAVATGALLLRALLAERQTVDDVFIFLRTARNLAERAEYAFDPGVRVEGTSSVAWTLALAAAARAGVGGIGGAKALSLGLALLVPAACAVAVWRAAPGRLLAMLVPALALALDADLATLAASGMDTMLWTLGCVAAVALAASPAAAAVALGALAWIRPEGPLFAALGVLALARDRRDLVRLAALAAAPIAVLEAWRLAYFHALVPNTFWAKMNAADGKDFTGAGYLASALVRRPTLLVLALAAALVAGRRAAPTSTARLALALLVASLTFAGLAGGDWMPGRRLLVVALPLAAILAGVAVAAARSRLLAVASCAALVGEAALTCDRTLDQTWRRAEWLDERVRAWRLPERPLRQPYTLDWMPVHFLSSIAPYVAPGDAVAHVDVGELPYVMGDVAFLDGFGLVDRDAGRVAFSPGDPALRAVAREAFFAARPVVAIAVLDESTGRPLAPAQDAAMEDPRFAAGWRELGRVRTWGDHPCVTYVRRDVQAADRRAAQARVDAWLSRVPDVVARLD